MPSDPNITVRFNPEPEPPVAPTVEVTVNVWLEPASTPVADDPGPADQCDTSRADAAFAPALAAWRRDGGVSIQDRARLRTDVDMGAAMKAAGRVLATEWPSMQERRVRDVGMRVAEAVAASLAVPELVADLERAQALADTRARHLNAHRLMVGGALDLPVDAAWSTIRERASTLAAEMKTAKVARDGALRDFAAMERDRDWVRADSEAARAAVRRLMGHFGYSLSDGPVSIAENAIAAHKLAIAERDTARARIADLENLCEGFRQADKRLRDIANERTDRVKALSDKLDVVEEQVRVAGEEHRKLREDLQVVTGMRDAARRHSEAMRDQRDAAMRQLDEERADVVKLWDATGIPRNGSEAYTVDFVVGAIHAMVDRSQQHRTEVAKLHRELEDARDHNNDARRQLAAVQGTLIGLVGGFHAKERESGDAAWGEAAAAVAEVLKPGSSTQEATDVAHN